MKTTVTFINSRNRPETITFEVVARNDLTREEQMAWIQNNGDIVTREDWEDDDVATIEKRAAQQVGITPGTFFYIRRA